jgi:exosome complex exonuclease RRP6
MFDTHQAARVLGHKQQSYAYLLKYYTNTDTDKKYQLADWRIRPLT